MHSDPVGAQFEVRPSAWLEDSSRFRGFKFSGKAYERSFVEVHDLQLDVVNADLSPQDRLSLGCMVPAKDYSERVGQSECREDRKGLRQSDSCSVTHRAVGARRYVEHPLMRKIIMSKPAGDAGEETVIKRVNGHITDTLTLKPGQKVEVFSPPGETSTRRVSIDVTTTKIGADGASSYSLYAEWEKP